MYLERIGSIQVFRHSNSLFIDHEKAFELDECSSRLLCTFIRTQSIVMQMHPYKFMEFFLQVS